MEGRLSVQTVSKEKRETFMVLRMTGLGKEKKKNIKVMTCPLSWRWWRGVSDDNETIQTRRGELCRPRGVLSVMLTGASIVAVNAAFSAEVLFIYFSQTISTVNFNSSAK